MTQPREFDQLEFERARRIRRAYAAARPTEHEVARAVARLGKRHRRSFGARALRAAWVVAALTLLSLGALAAARAVSPGWFAPRTEPSLTKALPSAAPRALPHAGRPAPAGAPLEASPSPSALASPSAARAAGAPLARPNRASVEGTATETESGAWARAAAALREGDHQGAQQALGELSRSSDARTRDAALLAQAELDLGGGAASQARAVLTNLAANGATPYIRERARQILAEKK